MSPGKKVKREDSDRPSKKMKESNGKPRDVITTPGPPPGVKPSKVVYCSLAKGILYMYILQVFRNIVEIIIMLSSLLHSL